MFVLVRLGCLNFSIFKHKYFIFHIHIPHNYWHSWQMGYRRCLAIVLSLYDVLLFPSSCIAITHRSLLNIYLISCSSAILDCVAIKIFAVSIINDIIAE